MNEQKTEYLKQIEHEIKRLEERIAERKEELKKDIDKDHYFISDWGLSKKAEEITKFTAQLETLYHQLHVFKSIFEIE
jgi:hypothetical protein